ncbi:MAG: O-antigen ligase family protein [Pseudomonadota bacterium]
MINTLFAKRTLKLRLQLAWWALPLVIAVPVLATTLMVSPEVNALTSWILLGFFLLLLPEACHLIQQWWKTRTVKLAALILLFCITAWHFDQGDLWLNAQARLYVSALLFGAALCAWFERTGDAGLRWAALLKIAVTCFAALSFITVILGAPPEAHIWSELIAIPPIYSNIRHFNFDLMIAIALLCLFWASAPRQWQRILLLPLFVLFGYLSVATAGRGALFALAVFGLTFAAKKFVESLRIYLPPILAFLFGGLLVFITGQGNYALGRVGQLTDADGISSGRTELWGKVLYRLLETPTALLFGYGPDAYRTLFNPRSPQVFHPHNAFVQWLLEFGLLGGVIVGVFWVRLNLLSLHRLRTDAGSDAHRIAAALLLAFFAYSLIDGMFYHAIPLTFIVIVGTYLMAKNQQKLGH